MAKYKGKGLVLNIEGDDEVKAALGKLLKLNTEAARLRVVSTAYNVQGLARRNVAVDQGETRKGIRIRYSGGLTAYVAATAAQSEFIEKGRKAGGKMPPSQPIVEWLQRHGLNTNLEFPVRKKIAEQGIEARPFFLPAWEAERGNYLIGLAADIKKATLQAGG